MVTMVRENLKMLTAFFLNITQKMSAALFYNIQLTVWCSFYSFGENRIGNKGFKALSEALRKCRNLETLKYDTLCPQVVVLVQSHIPAL